MTSPFTYQFVVFDRPPQKLVETCAEIAKELLLSPTGSEVMYEVSFFMVVINFYYVGLGVPAPSSAWRSDYCE